MVVLGGGGIDLLQSSSSPLHRESFMRYEILNNDKTNVGERPFLRNHPEGMGILGFARKKF